MHLNKVKDMWLAGKPIITGWCATPDPYTTEAMVRAGFDALILDMQHGMAIGPDRAAVWLQIVGQSDIAAIVRIPWNEPAFAQWVLDAGAMGVIIPMVNNVEDATKAIAACKYPPLGYRSYGPTRARFYGNDYLDRANDEVLCLLMMETLEGIENIEKIAKLPGCDGYFVGPADLAISIGQSPKTGGSDPLHVAAVQKVIDVAKKNAQGAGIFVMGPEDGLRRWKQGFNLNPVCVDIFQVIRGAEHAVSEFRAGLGG